MNNQGRNEKCSCNSGLKYKKCCLGSEQEPILPQVEKMLMVGDVECNQMFFDRKGIALVDTIMGAVMCGSVKWINKLEKQFKQQYPKYSYDNLINYMLKGTHRMVGEAK